MQRCPNCQSQQLDGTIFCSDCGATVQTPIVQQSTSQIGARQATSTPVAAERAPTASAVPLGLVIVASGRRLPIQRHDELLIGRRDEARGITPDIDLGNEGGYDAGVSRRHAIISLHDGALYVEDLQSANGTFVNGQRVEPHGRTLLRPGDELRCGSLVMRLDG